MSFHRARDDARERKTILQPTQVHRAHVNCKLERVEKLTEEQGDPKMRQKFNFSRKSENFFTSSKGERKKKPEKSLFFLERVQRFSRQTKCENAIALPGECQRTCSRIDFVMPRKSRQTATRSRTDRALMSLLVTTLSVEGKEKKNFQFHS
jgi:hypothetical protein